MVEHRAMKLQSENYDREKTTLNKGMDTIVTFVFSLFANEGKRQRKERERAGIKGEIKIKLERSGRERRKGYREREIDR